MAGLTSQRSTSPSWYRRGRNEDGLAGRSVASTVEVIDLVAAQDCALVYTTSAWTQPLRLVGLPPRRKDAEAYAKTVEPSNGAR